MTIERLTLLVMIFIGSLFLLFIEIANPGVSVGHAAGFSLMLSTVYFLLFVMLYLPQNPPGTSWGMSGHIPSADIPHKLFIWLPVFFIVYLFFSLIIRFVFS